MGKKKKGANKLAKMSDEERARYLQARADLEEEARRRKQQLIALFMKNKLKREDTFTRLNLAKIDQDWRTILRKLKCDELRGEVIKCAELCQISLARKDRIIQRLLSSLDESEEMYSKSLQSYTKNVLKLTDIHKERLKFWCDFYNQEKSILLEEFRKDIDRDREIVEKAKCDLECLYYAIEEDISTEKGREMIKAQKRTDDFRDMMTIRLEYVTNTRESVMERMWREFQMLLNNYTSYTKEFYEDYLELKQRDELETKVTENHYRELTKCTEVITDLRLETSSSRNSTKLTTEHLDKVKKTLQMEYTTLKKKVAQFRLVDKSRIRDLVTYSNVAKKTLLGLHRQAVMVQQLSVICRKFESDDSKYALPPRDNDVLTKITVGLPGIVDFKLMTHRNFTKLDKFWDRYNKVRLDCAFLIEEKSNLIQENQQLKTKLKQCLVDMTMQGSGGNKVVQVGQRPKSMTIERIQYIEVSQTSNQSRRNIRSGNNYRVTAIEGNLSVAIRSQSLINRFNI